MNEPLDLNEVRACVTNGQNALGEMAYTHPSIPPHLREMLQGMADCLKRCTVEITQLRSRVGQAPPEKLIGCPWCHDTPSFHSTTAWVMRQDLDAPAEVRCINPECPAQPRVSEESVTAAVSQWNAR